MTTPDSCKRQASEIENDEELLKKARIEMNASEADMEKGKSIITDEEVALRGDEAPGQAELLNTSDALEASFRLESTCKATAPPIESYKENQTHFPSLADSKLPKGLPSLDSLLGTLPPIDKPLVGDCEDAYADEEPMDKTTNHFINLPCDLLDQGGVSSRRTGQGIILYVRPRCLKQMVFMYDDVIRRGSEGHIYGQPGTGKSTTALYVAVQLAVEKRWNVLWAHLEASSTDLFWKCIEMRPEGTYSSFAVHDETFREAVTRFERTRAENGHLLIMDGIRFDDSRNEKLPGGFWLHTGEGRRRIIKISSDGRQLKLSSKARVGKIRIFRQWSWTLEEYDSAMANDSFRDSVQSYLDAVEFIVDSSGSTSIQQQVRQKYHVAGGCARWMFSYTSDIVRAEIDAALRTDDSYQPSRLFSCFANRRVEIVSEYAKWMISTRFGSEQIKFLASHPFIKQCNREVNGALFQLYCLHEFLRRAQENAPIELIAGVGENSIFNLDGVERKELGSLTRETCPINKLMWPINRYQESFDAIIRTQRDGREVVICIQITVGKTHDANLEPAREITRRLGANLCEFHFVIPVNMMGKFKIGKIINSEALAEFGWPTDLPSVRRTIMIAGLNGWDI